MTVAPSALVAITPNTSARVGVVGTLFENNDWAAGANANFLARRLLIRHVALVAAADGAVAFTSYDATFLTGGFMPGAELSFGGLSLVAGGRAAFGQTAVPDAALSNVAWHADLRSGTRTSVAPAYRAALQLGGTPSQPAAALWVRDDPQRVDGEHITTRSAGASAQFGLWTFDASAGMRRASAERMEFGGASASYAFSRTMSLNVAGGSYPSDPLTGASRGRFVSVGLGVRFGGEAGNTGAATPGSGPVRGTALGAGSGVGRWGGQ
jgi:hypothetical protein